MVKTALVFRRGLYEMLGKLIERVGGAWVVGGGWVGGRGGEGLDGRVDGCTDRWVCGQTGGRVDGWLEG